MISSQFSVHFSNYSLHRKSSDFEPLSVHPHCVLPRHYFESPGKIVIVAEAAKPFPDAESIILAEPSPTLRNAIAGKLRLHGYRVLECSGGQDALEKIGTEIIANHQIDAEVLVSDLSQATDSDVLATKQIAASHIIQSVIAFTADTQKDLKIQLEEVGARCHTGPISTMPIEQDLS